MFPSSGLFALLDCPLSKRGACERPYCLYRHAAEIRDKSGASHKSTFDSAGLQYSESGESLSDQVTDVCLQELERINREIESVRHEVEQEQRRLSHYQTAQANGQNTASVSKSETEGRLVDRDSRGLSTDSKKTYQRKKYMVDNSKPRTDLEYDPLSNFSADLCSYSSSGKEQKVKTDQGLKRARNTGSCDQKKPVTFQPRPSSLPSLEPLDEWNDNDVLIIDIPPSPVKKREQVQTPLHSVSGKPLPNNAEELKEVKPVPILLCAKAELSKAAAGGDVEENQSKCAENQKGPSNSCDSRECEDLPADGCVDLESPLQAAEMEVKKSPKSESPSAFSDLLVEKNTCQVKRPHRELPHRVDKMTLLQPYHFRPKNSLFYKAPAATSDSPCRQQTGQDQTAEPPARHRVSNPQSLTNAPSVLPHSQKTSSNIPGLMQGKAAVSQAPPESCLKQAEWVGQAPQTVLTSGLTKTAESLSRSSEQLSVNADNSCIIVAESSSDDDEPNYSDVELSDSDPMEECYRIFMEENQKGNVEPDMSVGAMDAEKLELKVKPQELPGRKRVAHEVKHTESVAKSRPQPQVLVPLRGPAVSGLASHSSITSKIQQVQQKASALTASIQGAQTFVSSSSQKRPDARSAPAPSAQTLQPQMQLAPVQNAYVNYIPLGTAVINVGNNLHLILPEGAFPVASSSVPGTSVLTPIGQVQTSTVAAKQMYFPPAVTAVQRCRTAAPVLIPALARKPSLTSAFASAHSSPATSTVAPSAAHVVVKPVPTKRKLKHQNEATKDKVPHDVRQRYVNMFTEEFLKTTANVNDAFQKALAEERTVYNRSVNKLKYMSVAVNALKKLKNHTALAAKDENEANSQQFRGNIPLNLNKCKGNADDVALYESLKDYILTEEKLIESNYPFQHPEKSGCAILFADNKKGSADSVKRICCRCGATYSVSQMGKHTRKEECNYHYGKGVTRRVPGGVETRYNCCEGVMGAPGCQVFKLHVHDSLSLDGFVSTVPKHPDTSCPGVYSLDCEMCYTIHGLELSRVTLVNSGLQVVYDTFVRPDSEVIDYNTRFSGISEEDVKGIHTSLKEVQETLLSFINADTILIGHGLETDLCALKLLHWTVVDTSVVFPHRLGPPHKLTLNNLTAEYLRRIIQESVCGHDTAEDAAACMELMLWKIKEDGKLKK